MQMLGLPRSLSNIGLYGNTNKFRLSFSSVREEFIVARAHLQYSGSRNAKDREEVEGSQGSPASRDSAEAQVHPWNSGARQSRTWKPKSDPI